MIKVTAKFLSELKDGVFRIDKGLYIRTRNGKQAYIFIYMFNRKKHEIRIGDVNVVTPGLARQKALEYRNLLAQGIDPIIERNKDASSNANKTIPTFAEFLPTALENIARSKQWTNEKSSQQWEMTLKTYALPFLGDKTLDAIGRDDILEVLSPIWDTKNETANRLRGRLEAVFDLAIVMGHYKTSNPAVWRGNLSFFLASKAKVTHVKHHDAISVDELKSLFPSDLSAINEISRAAVLFGALTASRVGEFVPARWDEIEFDRRVWLVPPERRKDKKPYPHRVPLTEQAITILNRVQTLTGKTEGYIFVGQSGVNHISKETPRMFILRRFKRGTMHGCRSTFRDWAAENGINEILAEKCLMHTTGNEVTQAYQRSDLLEQRRPVMQRWADVLTNKA